MKKARVLLISDEVDRQLYDHFDKSLLKDIDIIISCGDLPAHYLSFLATMFSGPVFYVHGNHDEYGEDGPEGCISLEDQVIEYNGIRFLGLGGTPGHKKKGWEFSQNQMARRIKRLWLKLWKSKGFDVLVTHAPAKGHHDGKGIHEGYAAFGELIRKYHPSYFFHGHMHMNYDAKQPRLSQLEQQTAVVNAWNKYVMDIIIPERAD